MADDSPTTGRAHAEKVAELFLIRGTGGAAGVVSAEALATYGRNLLNIQPAGPGNYVGLATQGTIKAVLGIIEAYAADAVRNNYPSNVGQYSAEFLDYMAAGSVASIFIDLLRTLGVSPLGYGDLGHIRPAIVQPPYGAYAYGPRSATPAGYGMTAAPGYATRDTIPVGVQAQVTMMPRQTLRPGQSIATAFPRTMVS